MRRFRGPGGGHAPQEEEDPAALLIQQSDLLCLPNHKGTSRLSFCLAGLERWLENIPPVQNESLLRLLDIALSRKKPSAPPQPSRLAGLETRLARLRPGNSPSRPPGGPKRVGVVNSAHVHNSSWLQLKQGKTCLPVSETEAPCSPISAFYRGADFSLRRSAPTPTGR